MDYIIGKDTYFLMFDGKKTVINELSTEIILDGNLLRDIINKSCLYYGSSLKGRLAGSKNLINSKYKLPIIISENNKIMLFSIVGIQMQEKIWINFNSVSHYEKAKDFVNVTFSNGYQQKFTVSYFVFNNQMLKCSRMWFNYLTRC